MFRGLNHITLAVSFLPRSLAFYTQLLGMKAAERWRYRTCGLRFLISRQ
jgi:catechol 2,3-dioxygenase-like lactoylglutathione lyase family enzyme